MPTTTRPEVRTRTTTPTAFRRRAERSFRKVNPDADITIEWTFVSRPFVGKGAPRMYRTGTFRATAPGYAPRLVMASLDMTHDLMNVGL